MSWIDQQTKLKNANRENMQNLMNIRSLHGIKPKYYSQVNVAKKKKYMKTTFTIFIFN